MKRTVKYVFLLIIVFAGMHSCIAQPLAGTDELGRTLPQNNEVGNPRDRTVAMFYFLWHEVAPRKNWDLSKIVAAHPEVLNDFDNPNWGSGSIYYYWGEPLYGYYKGDDYWVHLRNIQLLTDAGVDILVIDATNRLTYPKEADALMRAMGAVNKQGKKAPKIVFYTNTASGETMQEAYNNFYKEGAPYRHPECWYLMDGKPLILGITAEAKGKPYEEFFSYRESQWPNESYKTNGWPWIEFVRPQLTYKNSKGQVEIMNVSVAQHPNPTAGMGGSAFYGNKENWGRSYSKGNPGNPATDIALGLNFQEQWDYALTQNTPFIYVTGWNEWIAGKFRSRDDNPEHSWFCDQASPEYSRDIEPTRTAGLKDNYYMQLAGNIRRYKGIEVNPAASAPTRIKGLGDWSQVFPVYQDYTDDTQERNHPGTPIEPLTIYTNKTGRNDFDKLKVARDNKDLYFYAQTVKDISANSGSNWMRLYIDTDRSAKTGWKGYEYRVIAGNLLQQYKNDKWVTIQKVKYSMNGNQLMITIPRTLLNVSGKALDLEFKWSDNMQDDNDPLDWYLNGDAAPGGRFNFMYTTND